jgi:hypothetical protein
MCIREKSTTVVRAVEYSDRAIVLSLSTPDKAERVPYPVSGRLGATYSCEGI